MFAAVDEAVWQPFLGGGQMYLDHLGNKRFKGDVIGCFFVPLLLADQSFVHPSVRLLDHEGNPCLSIAALDPGHTHQKGWVISAMSWVR
jgi:hypothetical protein